jgi:hypothetical protein
MNYAMREKLKNNEAIDISKNPREGKYYILSEIIEGMDYCDIQKEAWIWSIGKRRSDGVLLASTTNHFFNATGFECVWLR